MKGKAIAAIDIGSNAVRLLINYVEEQEGIKTFKKAAFLRVPIRLGEDVFTSGEIGEVKRSGLLSAMKSFSYLMECYGVENHRACATSAMREAKNSAEVVEYIRNESGIDINIISGKEEANTIFKAGVETGAVDSTTNYLYVDVGGGSTEVTLYSNGRKLDSESFPLGTVRIISQGADKQEWKRFKKWLEECTNKYNATTIIGSGGNINKINKMLSKKEREPIRFVELQLLYEQLNEMSYHERISKLGLNTYRADVIMPALKIFITVCKVCKINNVVAPKIGLADGIIRSIAAKM